MKQVGFWRPCRGLSAGKALSTTNDEHMACKDGEQRSAVLQQHFIAHRRGKSCSNGVAPFPKFISQNREYLAARSVDFDENRTRWS